MSRSKPRIGLVLLALSVVIYPQAALSQSPPPKKEPSLWERSPREGPRGTVIKVSGKGCTDPGGPAYDTAKVGMYRSFKKGEQGEPWSTDQQYDVRSDGTWAGDFVVPATAPIGEHQMDAVCNYDGHVSPVYPAHPENTDPLLANALPFEVTAIVPSKPPSPLSKPPSPEPPLSSPTVSPSALVPSHSPSPSSSPSPIALDKTSDEGPFSALIVGALAFLLLSSLGITWQVRRRRPRAE